MMLRYKGVGKDVRILTSSHCSLSMHCGESKLRIVVGMPSHEVTNVFS